jgi:hypothetical protein
MLLVQNTVTILRPRKEVLWMVGDDIARGFLPSTYCCISLCPMSAFSLAIFLWTEWLDYWRGKCNASREMWWRGWCMDLLCTVSVRFMNYQMKWKLDRTRQKRIWIIDNLRSNDNINIRASSHDLCRSSLKLEIMCPEQRLRSNSYKQRSMRNSLFIKRDNQMNNARLNSLLKGLVTPFCIFISEKWTDPTGTPKRMLWY